MKLTPLQQFVQNACILAAHKGMSLEDARNKESRERGCFIKAKKDGDVFRITESVAGGCTVIIGYDGDYSDHSGVEYLGQTGGREIDDFEIIGLPPTLPRLLNACGLGYQCIVYPDFGWMLYCPSTGWSCEWKLLNDDGADATFFNQSEETQKTIAKLLGMNTSDE